MEFVEQSTLACRGPIDQLEPMEVSTFLRGKKHVAHWEEDHSHVGCDSCYLYPAWVGGERSWIIEKVWCPGWGYSAEGTEESILEFEDGVNLLMRTGCFDIFFSKPDEPCTEGFNANSKEEPWPENFWEWLEENATTGVMTVPFMFWLRRQPSWKVAWETCTSWQFMEWICERFNFNVKWSIGLKTDVIRRSVKYSDFDFAK